MSLFDWFDGSGFLVHVGHGLVKFIPRMVIHGSRVHG
jgi:hypothetical protein